jgi:hypothetical protein
MAAAFHLIGHQQRFCPQFQTLPDQYSPGGWDQVEKVTAASQSKSNIVWI